MFEAAEVHRRKTHKKLARSFWRIKKAEIDVRKPHNLGELYFNDSIRKPFLDKLIDNLESRFQEKDIMASFAILNPQRLPQLSTNPSPEELKLFMDYRVRENRKRNKKTNNGRHRK